MNVVSNKICNCSFKQQQILQTEENDRVSITSSSLRLQRITLCLCNDIYNPCLISYDHAHATKPLTNPTTVQQAQNTTAPPESLHLLNEHIAVPMSRVPENEGGP